MFFYELVISNHHMPLLFKVYEDIKETQLKFFYLIQEGIDKGIIDKGSIICMDRVYRKLIKYLKDLNITVVVYGKTVKRPYNSEVERLFGNVSKTIYKDMEFVNSLSKKELVNYLYGLCKIYYEYNKDEFLMFLNQIELDHKEPITQIVKEVK